MSEIATLRKLIRPCVSDDQGTVLDIINRAAEIYRGVIPSDRWRVPYMPIEQLLEELQDGVRFSGMEIDGNLVGVMGVQRRANVQLIRHAYVRPEWQGHHVGSSLIEHLRVGIDQPILIGTWAAAHWAIRFYECHGFRRAGSEETGPLLRTYWRVPDQQIEASVVLTSPPMDREEALRLMAAASE